MDIVSILNILIFALPLLWLIAILIHWLKFRDIKLKWVKYGILTALALFAVTGAYTTIATYNLWKNDAVSRYLLPPYAGAYFYQYAFFHFWRSYAIILSAGLIWAGVLWSLYKYSRGRFLDKTDAWLGFFTALIAGWPNFIIYLILIFGFLLAEGIVNNFIFKNKNPIAVAPSIILSALIVIIFGGFFLKLPFLGNLKL